MKHLEKGSVTHQIQLSVLSLEVNSESCDPLMEDIKPIIFLGISLRAKKITEPGRNSSVETRWRLLRVPPPPKRRNSGSFSALICRAGKYMLPHAI